MIDVIAIVAYSVLSALLIRVSILTGGAIETGFAGLSAGLMIVHTVTLNR